MTERRERRQARRTSVGETVSVSWIDSSGAQYHAQTRCLDVSETGIRVELNRRIEAGSYVNIKAEKYRLNASAKVRNIVSKGLKYHVGLEFNSAWRWKDLARYISTDAPSAVE